MPFNELAEKVMKGNYLDGQELEELAGLIQNKAVSDNQFVAILTAMQTRDEIKGRSIAEYSAFIECLREKPNYTISGNLCNSGTGGDRVKTLNISTPASIVIASAGIPVLKIGSKGTTGTEGSREAFQALGLNPLLELDMVIQSTKNIGIGYYDFSKLIPIHGRSGLRTPLNYIGPLCHPTRLENKVLGCTDREYAEIASNILKNGVASNYLISYNPNIDEISLSEPTTIIEKRDGQEKRYELKPREEGLPHVEYSQVVRLEDYSEATKKIVGAISGEETPVRQFIAINAGAGIYLAGKARSISEGFEIAEELMKKGVAFSKLEEWKTYQNERKK